MKGFINLGLLVGFLLVLSGCGSEAPGAYDDTKPNTTAFSVGELTGKTFKMISGSTTLFLQFGTGDYTISSSTNTELDWGEYSINDDGTVTLGRFTYERGAILSDTLWELFENEDTNGDGFGDRYQPVTWSLDSSVQTLAFNKNELDGQVVYILNDDANEKRIFSSSSFMGSFYAGDGSETLTDNYMVNYSISDGSIVTQWGDVYRRVAINSNSWSVEKSYDLNGDRIVDRTTTETWYTQVPSSFYQ